jgi:predicted dehydrogenase
VADEHRVAVVGLGIGQAHVWSFRRMKDRYTVAAVCDLDGTRARDAAERTGADILTFDEILQRDDIAVVDLCTPPSLHLAQARAALDAGKDVICEKPLVASLAEVDELMRLEADSPGTVMPIFQYRFGNGLQKVKALVDAGLAGPASTSTVEVAWRRRPEYYAVPWRGRWATELGGVLLSQAIHALDMLTYVAGPAERVFCRTTTRVNDIEVEDCASASLVMAGGSLATVSATLGSPQEITRHRFHFSRFSAESGTAPYESSADPWVVTADDDESAAAIDEVLDGWTSRPEGWWGQFERYADARDSGGELPVTLQDAHASLELITALYASSRSGTDVELPIEPDHPLYDGWLPERSDGSAHTS